MYKALITSALAFTAAWLLTAFADLFAGAGFRLHHEIRGQIFAFDYATANSRDLILQESGGNVGIGTINPAARLDVRGDIKLGALRQYQAAAGTESLRLLRGTVDRIGTIIVGTVFTSQRRFRGDCRIACSWPFAGVPTVTASGAEPNVYVCVVSRNVSDMLVQVRGPDFTALSDGDGDFCVIGPR